MSQKTGKIEKDVKASAASRLLVICVDRDDDVGEKTGIQTPVVGRDACIEAAQRLALEDPEDADSNSIFAAIRGSEVCSIVVSACSSCRSAMLVSICKNLTAI